MSRPFHASTPTGDPIERAWFSSPREAPSRKDPIADVAAKLPVDLSLGLWSVTAQREFTQRAVVRRVAQCIFVFERCECERRKFV